MAQFTHVEILRSNMPGRQTDKELDIYGMVRFKVFFTFNEALALVVVVFLST